MQKKIIEKGPLLNEQGGLAEAGYATSLIRQYRRKDIKANSLRIKEWDYYLVSDGRKAAAFTIADNSYMGMLSASWLDLEEPSEITKSEMTVLPRGKFHLPETSERGDISFKNAKVDIEFRNDGKQRRIHLRYPRFREDQTFWADLILSETPKDSMVIATPYADDPKAFYYNQKINCLKVKGSVQIGSERYIFDKDAYAVLDWGRGVWTYSNTWYWSSASGEIGGHRFGFNLGYGFGDTSAATENMLFYDGKAHKLEDVTFEIPQKEDGSDDFMSPWSFTSSDGRFEASFTPVIDRKSDTNVLVIRSDQHQVFGTFTGKAVLDDGTVVIMKDFPGFAEKVRNRW
ncbi:MAG: DUF2804 domain-containing protein [Solobacterium sp.]|nr:DUF2804 domain-containing protein [Solobacterium sp.]